MVGMKTLGQAIAWATREEPPEVYISTHPHRTHKALRLLLTGIHTQGHEIAQLTAERDRYKLAVEEVATHLGAVKSIIEYAIETKPERCLLTEKYNGLCPHCESDISWLQHELKAHGEYTAIIESALGKEAK